MRAIVKQRYGGPEVLRLMEIDRPQINEREVLVRIHAASVNPYDWHTMRGIPRFMRLAGNGFWRPKQRVAGADLAGVVEAVGAAVTMFKPGDEVFGMRDGAFAEYVNVREGLLAHKPPNITFEQAAAVPMAALTALQGLRWGGIGKGRKVLIIGASGGIGTFAVQLARHFGAEVSAVCSTRNVDRARSLGAHRVFDYTREDFVRSGLTWDLILDGVASRSAAERLRVLAPDGALVVVGAQVHRLVRSMSALWLAARVRRRNAGTMLAQSSKEDLELLGELLEKGDVTPVIERTYPLAEVPAAVRFVGQGHSQGKHVIVVRP